MLKRTIGIMIGVTAVFGLMIFCGGCAGGGAKKGAIVLRAADDHPLDYPTTQGLLEMGKIIEKKTNGRIKVKVFPSAALGSETQTIENTQMGTLDINRVSCAPLTEFSQKIGVFSMPYIFRDAAHFRKVLDGPIGEEAAKDLEPKGLKLIAYYDSGARSFYNTKRAINTPDDLKGLKIRTQKSQVMVDLVNALGAAATPMSFEEVYSSLQTGVIEGAENNTPSYLSTNHYEVAKYYSLNEHARVPDVVLISMKTWNKLSDADKKIVADAAKESEKAQSELWAKYDKEALEKVKASGCKINKPDPAPFREKVKPMYEKYRAQFGDLIDRIQEVK
ncbi:MAG TPA: TRAP transporter substrate-binding protein [bacterium]|nr:TRAP transporter substrate-binding protein [bacterium]